MLVVVASDKFKGSVGSEGVAAAIGHGVRQGRPDVEVDWVPVADGGDGTLAAVVAAGFELIPVTACGPTGEPVQSGYARRGDTAVVELADVCGLVRLPGGVPAPMTASSRGVGEVLSAAITAGCTRVILGIGGSASTDGGAGLIRALGARILDAHGKEVPEGGAALLTAESLDLSALHQRLAGVELIVASDVDNPLTGPTGAAATYAPQKGATPTEVTHLNTALTHWADLLTQTPTHTPTTHNPTTHEPATGSAPIDSGHGPAAGSALTATGHGPTTTGSALAGTGTGCGRELGAAGQLSAAPAVRSPLLGLERGLASAPRVGGCDGAFVSWDGRDARDVPGAGAAGGVGFVVVGVLGGELRAGIELVLELVGFRERLAGADLLVTGEGKLDEQTLRGKAVVGVAAAGAAAGVPVVAVCGTNTLDDEQLQKAGIGMAYALTDLEPDVRRCIADPVPLLRLLGEQIAADLR